MMVKISPSRMIPRPLRKSLVSITLRCPPVVYRQQFTMRARLKSIAQRIQLDSRLSIALYFPKEEKGYLENEQSFGHRFSKEYEHANAHPCGPPGAGPPRFRADLRRGAALPPRRLRRSAAARRGGGSL